jgi:hypothetical protein
MEMEMAGAMCPCAVMANDPAGCGCGVYFVPFPYCTLRASSAALASCFFSFEPSGHAAAPLLFS